MQTTTLQQPATTHQNRSTRTHRPYQNSPSAKNTERYGSNNHSIKNSYRNAAPATCRFASLLINQHAGTPFFSELYPEYEGCLPAEQSLWAVGAQGLNERGRIFARAALYSYFDGTPSLVMHADLNTSYGPDRGTLRIGHRDQFTTSVSPAKIAAFNWVMGTLFGADSAGTFDLKSDMLAKLQVRPIKRMEYAFDRTSASNAEMFKNHCELVPFTETDVSLHAPGVIPLIAGAQLPIGPNGINTAELPIAPFNIAPAAFRAYALGRLAIALRRATGEFREIKAGFARQFEIAQELLDSGNSLGARAQMERAVEATKKDCLAHLAYIRLPEEDRPAAMSGLVAAVDCLRTFYRSRTDDGLVKMFCPGRIANRPELTANELKEKQAVIFAAPTLRTLSGFPVQVIDDFQFNGTFPVDGRELGMF